MKKIVKKSTKKTVEPEFIMNCVDNTTPAELYNEVVSAKVRAGKPISKEELELAKDYTIGKIVDTITDAIALTDMIAFNIANLPHTDIEINGDEKLIFDANGNFTVKKPNIFKRFWNWIRRK